MENLEGPADRKGSSPDKNNNENVKSAGEKYGLRPRTGIKRLQYDLPLPEVSRRSSKSKPRPAPLSKYRRKTANARERHRMKAINSAFESLRKVLPEAVEVHTTSSSMTKITTLRHAVDYIRALSDVLDDYDGEADFTIKHSQIDVVSNHGNDPSFLQSLSPVSAPVSNRQHPKDPPSEISSASLTLHYKGDLMSQYAPHLAQLMSYYSTSSNNMSVSCSPSTSRGSLGSTSDLEELLSDDSGLLEDNLDVFHDIPTITLTDPFEVLLEGEKGVLAFPSDF